ncbi:MAG: YigZ family protein [Firmicutes bacterium]|nr:YigZ family protein [Bacillota bacterium]
MLDKYRTITQNAQAEFVEKKSRFIAYVRKVSTEEEARAFIDEIKKKHWDATHNVFAYQVGENGEIQRFSDDGEPQGTAGMPVLNVLKGGDIRNTAIVVTRYFGGILLGTGGLVRAYGKAASLGIEAAGISEMVLMHEYEITADYSLFGKIEYYIQTEGFMIKGIEYTDKVRARVLMEPEFESGFLKKMSEVSSGQDIVKMIGEERVARRVK